VLVLPAKEKAVALPQRLEKVYRAINGGECD
jgi:hypothetical protein